MGSSPAVQDLLMRECEEFQQLTQRHRELDSQLSALTQKQALSAEERIEEITLKKKKLAIKVEQAAAKVES